MSSPTAQNQKVPRRGFKRWEKAGVAVSKQSEVLDIAFGVFRRNGGDLMRLLSVPAAITFGMIAVAWQVFGSQLLRTNNPTDAVAQAGELALLILIATLSAAPVILIAYSYISAAASLFIGDQHLGKLPNLRSIHIVTLKRLVRLALSNFVVLLFTFGGMAVGFGLLLVSAMVDSASGGTDSGAPVISAFGILGIIAGAALGLAGHFLYCLAPIIITHEDGSVRNSLKRSKELMKGRVAAQTRQYESPSSTVFSLYFCAFLVWLLLYFSIQLPANFLYDALPSWGVSSSSIITKVFYQIISISAAFGAFALIIPVIVSGITVVYFDRRVRLEGFDIELLAQEVWRNDRAVDFEL